MMRISILTLRNRYEGMVLLMTKRTLVFALAIVFFIAAEGKILATPFGEAPPEAQFTCGYTYVSWSFTAKLSRYYITGSCLHNISRIQVPWSAQGTYEPASAA